MLGRALAVTGEEISGTGVLPTAPGRQPARQREMVERDHRRQAILVARGEHPPVVLELRAREEALLGLDARPLDGEAVRVEAERGEELDVVGVAVVVVARVSRRLGEQRRLDVLEQPVVVVDVVAFDLVGRRRRAPQESLREAFRHRPLRVAAGGRPGQRRRAGGHEKLSPIHLRSFLAFGARSGAFPLPLRLRFIRRRDV